MREERHVRELRDGAGEHSASAGPDCASARRAEWPRTHRAVNEVDDTPVGLVLGILRAYQRHGLDPEPALRDAGIAEHLLQRPQAFLPAHQLEALTTRAMRDLDDEGLGLFSRRLRPGSFEMAVRACLSASHLGDALQRWCRYRRVQVDDLSVALQVSGATASIVITELRPLAAAERDLALLSVLRQAHGLACWMIDSQIPLIEAAFPGPGPAFRGAYMLMFPGPVHFQAHQAALRFSADYLGLAVQRDEAATLELLSRPAQLMVKPYQRDRLLVRRARKLLLARSVAPITAEMLARELNFSARSLHRHLAQEGISFQQIKDSVRMEQAIDLLNRSHQPLKRIASQLAFSSEKSFTRAFRRWTGTTPNLWRQRARAQPEAAATAPAAQEDSCVP
jgi:AraC-like DNA-binding protein